jgi:hypothetical protein
MSRVPIVAVHRHAATSPAPVPAARPTFFDYLLLMVGCALSLVLVQIMIADRGLRISPTADTPPDVARLLLPILPFLLFLPEGIILLWPLFYSTQWLRGRKQPLTGGEWLWGVAWILSLAFLGWLALLNWGDPPEFLNPAAPPPRLWFYVIVPALAGIALLIFLIDLFGRWRQPWTHSLSLVLALWPVLPLVALLVWGRLDWSRPAG